MSLRLSDCYLRGVKNSNNQHWVAAILEFTKVLEIDPDHTASQVHLLEIYLIKNNLQMAKHIIENIDEVQLGSLFECLFYFFEYCYLLLVKRKELASQLATKMQNDELSCINNWNFKPLNQSMIAALKPDEYELFSRLEDRFFSRASNIIPRPSPSNNVPSRSVNVPSQHGTNVDEADYLEEDDADYKSAQFKKYKIGEYIELVLEDDQVNIYVNGKLFDQCKYLVLEDPEKKTILNKDHATIDEVLYEQYGKLEDPGLHENYIPGLALFWGHCSCVQAWVESGYDAGLMHINLAFPLLRELSQAGDQKAKKAFENEILNRWKCGNAKVQECLLAMEYMYDMNDIQLLEVFKYASTDLDLMEWFCEWDWDFLLKMWPSKNLELQEYILKDDYLYEMPVDTLKEMRDFGANEDIKKRLSDIMNHKESELEEMVEYSY